MMGILLITVLIASVIANMPAANWPSAALNARKIPKPKGFSRLINWAKMTTDNKGSHKAFKLDNNALYQLAL
ncbi:hypothetical protein [Legionella clemsonensis]|uniref:hypothetical protein n=1 Tax=Legionella clemsonensis TaxID=1867846 RepID=UPI0012FDB4DA|nr:hypothetical protein [Legionella clemsonensis]